MSHRESTNGYASPGPTDELPGPRESPPGGPPRVWTVFATLLVAIVLSVASQAVVGAALAAWAISQGRDPKNLAEELIPMLMSPPGFIGMLILGQLSIFVSAMVAAKMSPVPVKQRIGLVSPRCPAWALLILVLGSTLPLAVSVGAAQLVARFIEPDASVAMLYEQMTIAWAIPFIVLIGLLPGIAEELLFRGYVQRRFIDRWGPGMGIAVTSLLFGLFHITPHGIALATIIGVWLGVMAYRTGSVVPGMLCHAAINSGWNVWQVGKKLWGLPEIPSMTVSVIGVSCMVVLFAAAIGVLATQTNQADGAPSAS